MASSTTKLQALFGVLLLVTVGPVSGMMTGTGAGPLQTAGNDIPGTSAGNQAVTTAGNEPTRTQSTQTPASTAGNQATGPLSTSWNGSTEPNASAIEQLAPRENDSHPYPLVGDNQPTDPDGDGLYEDVNGDGAVNIVDVDALSRHLGSTAAGANWSAYDYTGDNRTDVGDIQWLFNKGQSTLVNDTDGDGLPDSYERSVTRTDPTQADSNGDNIIDGLEDWDSDSLVAYTEFREGTDSRDNDTDGDGLSDGFETPIQELDPTNPDTDGDGVTDAEEDLDGDGLTVETELRYNTSVRQPDTDYDSVSDGNEVNKFGTDPRSQTSDNDTLTDGEEVQIGTDPNLADSDADGVRDGQEDFDDDELVTRTELDVGLNPFEADTDSDGLPDGFEEPIGALNATHNDTDSDGTLDGVEDIDTDGLTNRAELDNGTLLSVNDTDGDSLTDAEEIKHYGTNPLVIDTDNDTVPDGLEVKQGTDPLSRDSDGDGTPDRNETVTITISPETSNATVEIQGSMGVSQDVSVKTLSSGVNKTNMTAGPILHVRNETSFESATVTIPIDSSVPESELRRLTMLKWNGSTSQPYQPINSTVDAENRTVSATVQNFSFFVPGVVARTQGEVIAADSIAPKTPLSRSNLTSFDCSGECHWDSTPATPLIYEQDKPRFYDETELRLVAGTKDEDSGPNEGISNCRGIQQNVSIKNGSTLENQTICIQSISPASGTQQIPDTGRQYRVKNPSYLRVNTDTADAQKGSSSAALIQPAITSEQNTTSAVLEFHQSDSEELKLHHDSAPIGTNPSITVEISAVNRDWTRKLQLGTNGGSTRTIDLESFPGERFQISIEAHNVEASFRTKVYADSDGDSLYDYIEQKEIIAMYDRFHLIELDPHDADTDGDGISDGREISYGPLGVADRMTITSFRSDPSNQDTDGDGLSDGTEFETRTVQVGPGAVKGANSPQGASLRDQTQSKRIKTSPLDPDTDDDGLRDESEQNLGLNPSSATSADPRVRQSQALIESLSPRQRRVIGFPSMYGRADIDDASADFDFVIDDAGSSTRDKLVFTALDGTGRTDTWLGNKQEFSEGTDPLDPDTDDDGLTDGQEVKGLTKQTSFWGRTSLTEDPDLSFGTDPTDADTDGDKYWDGWIGVYGVGHTDNVILYREHLNTGSGIEGNEIISEQAGYHDTWEAPSPSGIDIDGDELFEHSNLHIGELHWRSVDDSQPGNPTSSSVTPSPSLSVEVDYDDDVDPVMLDAVKAAAENYEMYDVDVTYYIDDELTRDDLTHASGSWWTDPDNEYPPTTRDDADEIQENYHDDTENKVYLYLTPSGGGDGLFKAPDWSNKAGVASSDGDGQWGRNFGMVVFQEASTGSNPDIDTRIKIQKVVMHETGHIIGVGRGDDSLFRGSKKTSEVYSGTEPDPDEEKVSLHSGGSYEKTDRWSIMSKGWSLDYTWTVQPEAAIHLKFSIQEVFTLEVDKAVEETHEIE
ncbi:dockerin type I domain-containing protein [Haloarcula sp. K1]|uniref:dockerin type I domain-containing protein n=1 Tax=Haloarcula sp. K1 TaxID=1622207 RepID=UPI000A61B2D1|nr:dockerin type I domain-containing protein [Haloarcula sp. K1]